MPRSFTLISALASALLLGVSSTAALAQRGGGGGAPPPTPAPTAPHGDLDRTQDRLCDRDGTCDYDQDRDRDRDRDTTGDQDRDQDRDRDTTGDQDRDQDRLHTAQVIDDQFASLSLLTSEERAAFRNEMRTATTAEERNRIRARHQQTIQDRAREMGIEAPSGAGAPLGYQARGGYMLMSVLTEQERTQFRTRMRSAQSAEERQRIRTEMHTTARERAREMGIEVPEWYGMGPGPR